MTTTSPFNMSNNSSIASYFRSFGYEVSENNGKCFVKMNGVSIPVEDGDTIFTLEYKYKKIKENMKQETGMTKSLTYWPKHFQETSNEIIAKRREWIAELLAKLGIQTKTWKKDDNEFTTFKTSIGFNGDESTLTNSQRTEYKKYDGMVSRDLSSINKTNDQIEIYQDTIAHERAWIGKCQNMQAIAEATERQLGLA